MEGLSNCDEINRKILNNKANDIFIFFYWNTCPHSIAAKSRLKNDKLSYKGYEISKNTEYVLNCLRDGSDKTGFDRNHRTVPIVFYKGKFIGGNSDLNRYLDSQVVREAHLN